MLGVAGLVEKQAYVDRWGRGCYLLESPVTKVVSAVEWLYCGEVGLGAFLGVEPIQLSGLRFHAGSSCRWGTA